MNIYKRHRFPPDTIFYAFWLYYRFNLSHRWCARPFVEDTLVQRGITVRREASAFGPSGSEPYTHTGRSEGIEDQEDETIPWVRANIALLAHVLPY